MSSSVTPSDLTEIMSVQIDKAKEGNTRAAAFVLKQVEKMTAAARQPITITQNNFYDGPEKRPDTPASERPGEPATLEKMRRRAQARMPLRNTDDGPRPMSDEEEKEFRRRQEVEAE